MFYMFLADGFEEVEATAALDVLRRAGIKIESVGIGSKEIVGAHKITLKCDRTDAEVFPDRNLEGIILPGGAPGTFNLMKNEKVGAFVDFCFEKDLFLCAICAAPIILGRRGVLKGRRAVCFPGFEKELNGAEIPDAFVCRDGKIVTARGMGCAVDFGLAVAAAVKGENAARELKAGLQCP